MIWKATLLICIGFIYASSGDLMSEWSSFKATYNKKYSSPMDEMVHRNMFARSLASVLEFNSKPHSYTKGINAFSDFTQEEMKSMVNYGVGIPDGNMMKNMRIHEVQTRQDDDDEDKYGGRDYRKEGAVTRIKNQGRCASCWAFATVAALESQAFIHKKVKNLTELSEGHLVDCYKRDCNGQYCWEALKYIKKNGGLPTESDYPYNNTDGKAKTCQKKKKAYSFKITGHKMVKNENALFDVVSKIGPVAIQLCITNSWTQYTGGVYDDEGECQKDKNYCNSWQHAVTVVGYGTDPEHGEFWILKNSWGDRNVTSWGEDGYMRIKKGINCCGMADLGVYPTF